MKWKRVKLLDNFGKWIFMDEYGFCSLSIQKLMINDKDFNQVFAYVPKNKRYERMDVDVNNLRELIETIFKGDLATRNLSQNRYPYGNYGSSSFVASEASEVKIKNVTIYFQVSYYTDVIRGQTNSAQEQIELDSLKDFDKYECWITDNFSNNSYQLIDWPSLKEGDEAYLVGEGKVTVEKMFDYPNKKNIACEVVDVEGNKHSIEFNREAKLIQLPYVNKKTILDEIDEAFNELLLSPFINSKEGVYNIYWKSIPEASRYTVSLYKLQNGDKKCIYHLADFDVERNICYLVLDKLIGDFIFKVSAEDRNGKIVAKSRGISRDYPKYFNE